MNPQSHQLNLHLSGKVAGRYKIQKFKSDSEGNPIGEPLVTLEFDNLITDTGMQQIWSSPTDGFGVNYLFSSCCVGTGNTIPTFTDKSLASWLASRENVQYDGVKNYVAGPPAYWKDVCTYQFGSGVAAGNLTEIGIYPFAKTKDDLFSRALILDAEGNPTTLVVESDESLIVTYEYRVYLDTDDVVGTFDSDGVTYDTVMRAADIDTVPAIGSSIANNGSFFSEINLYDGALGSVTTAPSGNAALSPVGTWSNFIFTGGIAKVDFATTLGINTANWSNGVRAIYFHSNLHKYQISFNDPATSKGILKVVGEQMTVSARMSWSRYSAT